MPGAARLLEREVELARIDRAITNLGHGHGGVLLIQGSAGIGKSVLLRALCEKATGQNAQTFTARASELERDFGFGIVRQLLERRVVRAGPGEQAQLLAGAASLAGPVLGLEGAVGDSFAALHGLYWLLANLAIDARVVLAVDDLQWADEPSLRWLIYLCRRLEDLPVLVAASTHAPRRGHSPLLAELLAVSGAQFLFPCPLSAPAVGQLVCEGLGTRPEPGFVSACAQATGGNPFVLRELVLDLAADGIAPSDEQAPKVAHRVPAQVERTVLARLGRLDPSAVRLAQAVVVLGEGTELNVAAALANLDLHTAATAVDALSAADLLAQDPRLRFVHPLVRSAIYEQLAPGSRSQAHARAARLLVGTGAGSEHIAAQFLSCQPAGEPDAVEALRAAAVAALARGAPETAITYLRRALDEPPAESVRAGVLAEMGGAERIARDPAAIGHLEQAWQATSDGVTRARLAGQLANVLQFTAGLDRYLGVLTAGLADLGDRDPDLAARLRASKITAEVLTVRSADVQEITGELRELISRSGSARRWVQLLLACVLALRGEGCLEVAGLVERGWDGGRFLAEESCEAIPTIVAVWAVTCVDELDQAQTLAEAMLVDAQARGSVLGLGSGASRRASVELRRGELAEAEADARAAFELVIDHHLTAAVSTTAACLALTLLERGDLDQAASVVEGIALGPLVAWPPVGTIFLEARGRVRLARGQRTQAIADLRQCGQLLDRSGLHNPNVWAWRSALALALAREQPQEACELAEAELALARRTGSARATGIALRVCGLVTGGAAGLGLLEQSVAILEATPMRLELAHSLTEWGAALRRAGARTAAREPLRRAMDLAARCGAAPLVERAREEALAAGARPRRPWTSGVHALTPSELRVARLAAQALGNREIAQALFITTKTVSDHLSGAYRKLNVSSRDQLAMAIAAHRD